MRLVAEMGARIRLVMVGSPDLLDDVGSWLGALADDMEIVSGASNGTRALDEVVAHMPDIVILHVEPYSVENLDLIRSLLTRFPAIRVVVITSFSNGDNLWRLVRTGVRAVLSRDTEPNDLVSALRSVQAGHMVIGKSIARSLFSSEASTPMRRVELQILRLLAQGLSYDEISERLAISRSTLKRYLRDIETKLEARNRVQAVARAARQGLI